MTTHHITLLRHGESQANRAGLLQGRADIPLTENGQRQAERLAETWLASGIQFNAIISSPLERARHTAEPFARLLGLDIELDDLWIERDFGILEGQPFTRTSQPEAQSLMHNAYFPPGGTGESHMDVFLRAGRAMSSLLRRPPGRYLVVSHGAFLNKILAVILGTPANSQPHNYTFLIGNTAYFNVVYHQEAQRWRIYGFQNPDEWQGLEWQ